VTHAFQTADSRGAWLVLADAATLDEAQASGQWLKASAAAVREVRR